MEGVSLFAVAFLSFAAPAPAGRSGRTVADAVALVTRLADELEALAEEMGLFSTDLARINRRLWPAHGGESSDLPNLLA